MDFFITPLLVVVLVGLSFKGLRLAMLKAFGWDDKPVVLEVRIGAILFLLCANVIAAIACWYPWYLCTYQAAPDDRYGMAIAFALPFWFIGPGISAWALFHLFRTVFRAKLGFINIFYLVFGILLAVGAFSPLFMLAARILKSSQADS